MFKRILVPLDGSARAERAACVAASYARHTGTSLLFLRVVHAPAGLSLTGEPPLAAMALAEADTLQAAAYLEQLARRDEFRDLDIETRALEGHVVPTILETIGETSADALVLCSRRRNGPARWVLGSVAHALVRSSPVPVLVLHMHGADFPPTTNRGMRALIALDGTERAECSLAPAADLVEGFSTEASATLCLARVVPFADAPASAADAREPRDWADKQHVTHMHMMEETSVYLDSVGDRLMQRELAGRAITVERAVLSNPDVSKALIDAAAGVARPQGYDLIVIATHGRQGLEGWMLGSIAERVLDISPVPVLVISTQHPVSTAASPIAMSKADVQTSGAPAGS